MFKSYEYLRYLGQDKIARFHKFEFKIIDSDFEESVSGAGGCVLIYEKRNLKVISNLVLEIKWCSQKFNLSLPEMIEWEKLFYGNIDKYEDELKKYLMFS